MIEFQLYLRRFMDAYFVSVLMLVYGILYYLCVNTLVIMPGEFHMLPYAGAHFDMLLIIF